MLLQFTANNMIMMQTIRNAQNMGRRSGGGGGGSSYQKDSPGTWGLVYKNETTWANRAFCVCGKVYHKGVLILCDVNRDPCPACAAVNQYTARVCRYVEKEQVSSKKFLFFFTREVVSSYWEWEVKEES